MTFTRWGLAALCSGLLACDTPHLEETPFEVEVEVRSRLTVDASGLPHSVTGRWTDDANTQLEFVVSRVDGAAQRLVVNNPHGPVYEQWTDGSGHVQKLRVDDIDALDRSSERSRQALRDFADCAGDVAFCRDDLLSLIDEIRVAVPEFYAGVDLEARLVRITVGGTDET